MEINQLHVLLVCNLRRIYRGNGYKNEGNRPKQ